MVEMREGRSGSWGQNVNYGSVFARKSETHDFGRFGLLRQILVKDIFYRWYGKINETVNRGRQRKGTQFCISRQPLQRGGGRVRGLNFDPFAFLDTLMTLCVKGFYHRIAHACGVASMGLRIFVHSHQKSNDACQR